MEVYLEALEDDKREAEEAKLPPLTEGECVSLADLQANQHFTEPPPRYSEASLVKVLEEFGIGRPSTYASIISTLQAREYAELENRRFRPTDIGRIVNKFLTQHFARYVDYDFTARLEDELDEISRGEKDWVPVMEQFWRPFDLLLKEKQESVNRSEVVQARELGIDPASGKPVSVRMGRFGAFVQIGTREDADKPRFAGLKPGQRMDALTLEEGLALFALPRLLGHTAAGEEVQVNIGRFGPYVKHGSSFVSLRKGDDPYVIELPRAIELIEAKRVAVAASVVKRFDTTGIELRKGRFGLYLTDGKKNLRLPKGQDADSLTEAECQRLLAEAPDVKRGRGRAAKAAVKPKSKAKSRAKAKPKSKVLPAGERKAKKAEA
jgi:DNA topoisomerase I